MYAPTIRHRGGGGRGGLPTLCVHICLVNYVCTHVCPHHSPQGGRIPLGGGGGGRRGLAHIYIYIYIFISIFICIYIYIVARQRYPFGSKINVAVRVFFNFYKEVRFCYVLFKMVRFRILNRFVLKGACSQKFWQTKPRCRSCSFLSFSVRSQKVQSEFSVTLCRSLLKNKSLIAKSPLCFLVLEKMF